MARVNWMEFRELVPSKINTVIVPTGTLEPHGVANNGADITAPLAMAQTIAPKVNAMIAPAVPYGITGSMEAYPGAFQIPEAAYRPYMKAVLEGMAKNGITGDTAEQIISSITAFALYGFPESHAASFALLAYASAYLKAHFPAAFYTALLNNQPMGFYHPATIIKDANIQPG